MKCYKCAKYFFIVVISKINSHLHILCSIAFNMPGYYRLSIILKFSYKD
ncbi:hypothetical protein A1OE_1051 [Candidatus Endolissoclinum faulkneri L2]|uniref:Uncharacterized protein n=1 Tax=Candidatus Endolissoclinum faulkneri L2 TaxID=1193729 RepID=K7YRP9_9PROT|nr:hypothetical protein A1OE_1051 [Candidatus Endolissoclinum faulkneri L2]